MRGVHVHVPARALTHPAETRESDPSTTPPSNSMAMIVVCNHHQDSEYLNTRTSAKHDKRNRIESFVAHLLRFSPPPSAIAAPRPSTSRLDRPPKTTDEIFENSAAQFSAPNGWKCSLRGQPRLDRRLSCPTLCDLRVFLRQMESESQASARATHIEH